MSVLTIDAANAIYACGDSLRIHRYSVAHTGFYSLCHAIKTFEQVLGEAANEEYWATFVRWLKRYRFHMLAAPLPFNWQDPRLPDLESRVAQHIARCNTIYPQFASHAHDLLNMFQQLALFPSNPLLERLIQVWSALPDESTAILVKETRLIPATEAVIRSNQAVAHKDIDVIAPTQADYAQCYQHLFVIGSVCWFPDHILSAPRANTIHIISYRWLANKWHPEPVFVGAPHSLPYQSLQGSTGIIPEVQASSAEEPEVLLEPIDILPAIDAKALSKRLSHTAGEVDPYQEDVPARLFVLAGDMGVFVEAVDQTKVLTINLANDDSDEAHGSVERIPFNELAPGMFILLRTEGGGDYIVPVADKLMGPELAYERAVNQHGYISIQRYYIYAERGLARQRVSIWLYEGRLHIEYQQTMLARYAASYDRKKKRLKGGEEPHLRETAFADPQLELWELDDEQWRKVLERSPRSRRRRGEPAPEVEQLSMQIAGLLVLLLATLPRVA